MKQTALVQLMSKFGSVRSVSLMWISKMVWALLAGPIKDPVSVCLLAGQGAERGPDCGLTQAQRYMSSHFILSP